LLASRRRPSADDARAAARVCPRGAGNDTAVGSAVAVTPAADSTPQPQLPVAALVGVITAQMSPMAT
jgi:hypothetical protein